jgi:phage terminase large subunit-like protein
VNPLVQSELEQLRRAVQAHQAGNIGRFLEEQRRQKDRSKALQRYRPYPKQMEFHNAGRDYRERMLMAPNQSGKTTAAAAETAMHLTGIYPDWFDGKRYDRPVAWMAASETGKLTRDGAQVHLCGAPKFTKGSGMIPADTIIDTPSGSSLKEAYDFVRVRHVSGGDSICYMRSYDQGSDRVQAMTLDGVWLDEEPEEQYYYECLARTSAVAGPVYTTLTPLKGMTKVVQKFIAERPPGTILIQMTLDDAEHYSPEQRASLIQSYPSYIREARTYGRPSKGSGGLPGY